MFVIFVDDGSGEYQFHYSCKTAQDAEHLCEYLNYTDSHSCGYQYEFVPLVASASIEELLATLIDN